MENNIKIGEFLTLFEKDTVWVQLGAAIPPQKSLI